MSSKTAVQEKVSKDIILKLDGISKFFGEFQALKRVSLEIKKGEILAVLGENGAGKSTLMKILSGLYQPDEGQIYLNPKWFTGEGNDQLVETVLENPRMSIQMGLSQVYQHFQLVETFTVAENITLGQEFSKAPIPLLDYDTTYKVVEKLSETYGLPIDPRAIVEDLPVGMKQRVEILKQLYREAELLILDEPSAVLTPIEVEELFKTMRNLKEKGKSLIFISHKLHEPLTIADRIVVIRGGEMVGEILPKDATKEILAEMVVGQKLAEQKKRGKVKSSRTVLRLAGVSVSDIETDETLIEGINLEIKNYKIYGIAGVVGNGQQPLLQGIMGLQSISKGTIQYTDNDNRVNLNEMSTIDILKLGIAYIPEDRSTQGLILDFQLTENMWLAYHSDRDSADKYYDSVTEEDIDESSNGGLTGLKRLYILPHTIINKITSAVVNKFNVHTNAITSSVRSLSGGNQQKVLLGREFSKFPKLIIASEPTRGVDIGVMRLVHENLIKMRDEGAAILLVSSDLDEILTLSDEILVMFDGKIVGKSDVGSFSVGDISQLMTAGEISKKEGKK